MGLKYYADTNDAPLSDLFRKARINPENQLIAFYDYSWKDCPETGRITGSYIIFYQLGPIDHDTYVPGPVSQSSAEIEYNEACTSGMALEYFRILIHELLNKDPYIFPEVAPIIVLDSNSSFCMAKNGKDTKNTSHIARRVYFLRNGENCKKHKIDWYEGGLKFSDIAINNDVDKYLNNKIKYIMVMLENWNRALVQEEWQDTGKSTEQEFCMTIINWFEDSAQSVSNSFNKFDTWNEHLKLSVI